MMDLFKAKTVKQCIDLATIDAYGDDEVAAGWETCLDEVFSGVKAQLAGQDVKLEGFDSLSGMVLARCRFGKRKIRVTLDSLDFLDLTAPQRIWLKAFLKWQEQGWGSYA
jgi:hypothetical protein